MIGIYKITNPNGRIYIGQSINIEKRKFIYSKNYNKHQKIIYSSIKKYGWEKHIFEIIEECTINKLDERELYWKQHYIGLLGWENMLFCQLKDGKGGFRSEETKRKISESNKGRKSSSLINKFILQYDLEGNFIKEWESGKLAALELNIKGSDISQCCHNKKFTSNGYIWFHKNSFTLDILNEKLKSIKLKYNNIKKPIIQLDIKGNVINEYESYMEAKRKSKINNIESALSGKQKTAGGFKWKYK